MITFESRWYDLCGWLGVKNQLSMYLFLLKYIYSSVSKLHAGSFLCFRNPPKSDMDYMIYITCVRHHCYAYVCTRGLGTPTSSQHNIFDSGKLKKCSCARSWRRSNSGHWCQRIWSPTLYWLIHPVTPTGLSYFEVINEANVVRATCYKDLDQKWRPNFDRIQTSVHHLCWRRNCSMLWRSEHSLSCELANHVSPKM